jgi:3-oxoadipate enol-lactonase
VAGPPGAPVVVLIHGWTATADLNWFPSFEALGRRFRVLAFDQRGHGRGARGPVFRLEDCADDVAAVASAFGVSRFLVAGYSLGGPIAQLTWRRHRDRVDGLVLCATARRFTSGGHEGRLWSLSFQSLALASRFGPEATRRWVSDQFIFRKGRDPEPWVLTELRRHDMAAVFEAGRELGRFTSEGWIGAVDVPCAVVITTNDEVVTPSRQTALAASIPGSRVFPIEGGHDVCVAGPEQFVPALVAATTWVSERARLTEGRAGRGAQPLSLPRP